MLDPSSDRWVDLGRAQHPHQRVLRDLLVNLLPDRDPVWVWWGLEVEGDDGALHHLDAVISTGVGLFALRALDWTGTIRGDERRWQTVDAKGHVETRDPPFVATLAACEALTEVLAAAKPVGDSVVPKVRPLTVLVEDDVKLELPLGARPGVVQGEAGYTLELALTEGRYPGAGLRPQSPTNDEVQALVEAMDQARAAKMVRRPHDGRRVGDYLVGRALDAGPTFQDFVGVHHANGDELRRIRRFNVADRFSSDEKARVRRAAEREFALLGALDHPGLLRPQDCVQTDIGPCLLYDYDHRAQRLDHFLEQHGARLGFEARFDLLRQLCDAVRYAHDKRVLHRALSPQTVLVAGGVGDPQPIIHVWQAGRADTEHSRPGARVTTHVDRLLHDATRVFLAPEIHYNDAGDETADVYGLGALACYLFSGQSPGARPSQVFERLRQDGGLRPSTYASGIPPSLDAAVHTATAGDPSKRWQDLPAFIEALDEVRANLNAGVEALDLLAAPPGATVEGWRIVGELGRGSTGIALDVVEPDGEPRVLKVARTEADAARLEAEAAALQSLEHPRIVKCHGVQHLGEPARAALVLARAGKASLRTRLRQSALGEEMLVNLGSDLVAAVGHALSRGVLHRDLKPENIGIGVEREGGQERPRLVLFDFSLAGSPLEATQVGTPSYRDPFLEDRGKWDDAAELYATGLVLYEMVTNTLPTWGDGRMAPPLLPAEVTAPALAADRFPAGVRQPLAEFFAKALHRDAQQRFTDAVAMRQAWRDALRPVATPHTERQRAKTATIDTPVAHLGLDSRILNVLDRAGIARLGQLLVFPRSKLQFMPGVGSQTRQQLLATIADYAHLAEAARKAQDRAPDAAAADLDDLLERITTRGYKASKQARGLYLGLLPINDGPPGQWPTAGQVADFLKDASRSNVLGNLRRDREHWQALAVLHPVRALVADFVDDSGGVAPPVEAGRALLARYPSAEPNPEEQLRHACAVVRAALEAELFTDDPAFELVREGQRVLLATDRGRIGWAKALGQRADELADEDPLLPPQRALDALRALDPDLTLPGDRLLQLAASFSEHAAVSSQQEIYPVGLPAERALALAQRAILPVGGGGLDALSPHQLRERVRARYPQAEPLPTGKALVDLVARAGLPLTWRTDTKRFVPVQAQSTQFARTQYPTTAARGRYATPVPVGPLAPTVPPKVQAFEDWLIQARDPGAWAIISTHTSWHAQTVAALASREGARTVAVADRLLHHLQVQAKERKVPWATVLKADALGPTHGAFSRLRQLVDPAADALRDELLTAEGGRSGPLVLTDVDLLARYERVDVLDALRQAVTDGRTAAHQVWVVVPNPGPGARVEGTLLPTVTPAQHQQVPRQWLRHIDAA